MRKWHLLLLISLTMQFGFTPAWSEGARSSRPPVQLRGLDLDDATSLIATLEHAQHRMRAGEFQTFELMAGAVASFDEIRVAPRDAFLRVPFKQLWGIERTSVDDQHGQSFKLAYMPKGVGELYWDIEVIIADGKLQRVHMTYRPPAPF
jgi:hypothetical protein